MTALDYVRQHEEEISGNIGAGVFGLWLGSGIALLMAFVKGVI